MTSELFMIADGRWFDFVMKIAAPERFTYMILIMHNQILNGGYHQYFYNGYG